MKEAILTYLDQLIGKLFLFQRTILKYQNVSGEVKVSAEGRVNISEGGIAPIAPTHPGPGDPDPKHWLQIYLNCKQIVLG